MLKRTLTAAILAASPALANDYVMVPATGSVAEVMDRLEATVTGAGATVFARVNHGGGAASVEMELADSELLIFGNPKLGTPALQQDILAGLVLPLKVLVYADAAGDTIIAYESVPAMFERVDVSADAPFVAMMSGALNKFSTAAAAN